MLYESEYLLTLAAARHDDEHAALLLRVPTFAVEDSNAALHNFAYLLGYLLMLVGNDGELNALRG